MGFHRFGLPTATTSPRRLAPVMALLVALFAIGLPHTVAASPPGEGARPDEDRFDFADRSVSGPTEQVTGVLTPVIDESLPDEVLYSIVRPDNTTEMVDFGGKELPDNATEAEVTAEVTADGLVRSATIDPVAPSAAVPGPHTAYVAVVDNFGGNQATDDYIQTLVDTALARYEAEGGRMITSFERVEYERYTFDGATCTSGSAMWNEAASELWPDVDFSNGVHLINVAPDGCAGGLGTVGTDVNSGGRLNIENEVAKGTQSLLHELGHNLSLAHAHSCQPQTSPTCSEFNDYGNSYEIMGTTWLPLAGQPPLVPPVFGTFERERLGFAAPDESARLSLPAGLRTATSTHDLLARSATSGLRSLRITDPVTGIEYVVSWRSGGGADADAYYPKFGSQTGFRPGIAVQQVNEGGTAASVLGYAEPTPTKPDFKQFGRVAGQTYAAGGVSITVVSVGDKADPASTSRVSVTLTNPSVPAEFARTTTPALRGSARVDSTLAAFPGAWSPATTSWRFQWLANGARVAGATRSTLKIAPGLVGRRISVQVTGSRAGYRPVTRTSAAAVVARGAFRPAAPKVTGQAEVGRTLRVKRGAWQPAPTRWTYRWLANGRPVTGAKGAKPTLKLTKPLKGKRISVKVTGTRPGYTTTSRTSPRSARVR